MTYYDSVTLTRPDGTVVQADKLSLQLPTTPQQKNKPLEKVTFTGNVTLRSASGIVHAQRVTILNEKRCELSGNVHLEHTSRNGKKNIPITMLSQKGYIDLSTNEIALQGTRDDPVETIAHLK